MYGFDAKKFGILLYPDLENNLNAMKNDCELMQKLLQAKLNKVPNLTEIEKVQGYIAEGKKLKNSQDKKEIIGFISKVNVALSGEINLGAQFNAVYAAGVPYEATLFNSNPSNDIIGLLECLEIHLERICNSKTSSQQSIPLVQIHNQNQNINSNQNVNQTSIDIVFKNAREKIEESEALSEAETKEALEKLQELEAIIKSDEKRKVKWSKIGSFFKWFADKSVDVAVAFMPMIVKSLELM
ncbi:MAG: hypothetical protein FWC11_04440 [Firmicutes bacterium]|nr:hypothetical protein [Bacillota bacterium]